MKHIIPVTPLLKAMKAARRADIVYDPPPYGWCIYPVNPEALLAPFSLLQLNPGWRLHTYVCFDPLGANTLTFGMPESIKLQEPSECSRSMGQGNLPPIPDIAEINFMTLIEGDGSPMAYAMASLASREIAEMGAFWHGITWLTQRLLGRNPWTNGGIHGGFHRQKITDESKWKWHTSRPQVWKPVVVLMDGEQPIVRFHTFDEKSDTIIRHEDRYAAVGMTYESTTTELAAGGGGFCF